MCATLLSEPLMDESHIYFRTQRVIATLSGEGYH